jgi:hypothetical protein
MKLFKRSENKRKKSVKSNVNSKGKVSFKKRKSSTHNKKSTSKKKFTKKRNSNSRQVKAKSRKVLQIAAVLFFVILLGGLIYISIIKILDIRKNRFDSAIDLSKIVYSMENIPEYPGSEFIYENVLDNETVQKTLSSGQSAYRIPPYKNIENVYEFYSEHLPDFEWTFIQKVPLSSPTMYSGQYWINDKIGLRIYTRLNDIWYEKITKADAENGLEDRKAIVIEREEVLAQDEDQTLLPGFAWELQFSSEYLLDYFSTDFNESIGVKMRHLVTDQITIFAPIGISGQSPEDTQIETYLNLYNKEHKETSWKIVNSMYVKKGSIGALQVNLTSDGESTTAYVVNNGLDNDAYLLVSFDNDTEFVEYILANIVDKSTLSATTDLKIYE